MSSLNSETTKPVTKAEVSKHNTPTDLWLIVNNAVYDLTEFQDDHPGGAKILKLWAGKDATKPFKKNHNERILRNYTQYVVGTLEGAETSKADGKKVSKWSFWRKSEKTNTIEKVGGGVIKKIQITEERKEDGMKEVVERIEVIEEAKQSKGEELKGDKMNDNGSARSTVEVLGDHMESMGL